MRKSKDLLAILYEKIQVSPVLLNRLSCRTSFLINGCGRFFSKNTNFKKSQISLFHVDEGNRYKFRLIGTSSNVCPLEIQIEDHNFTIIAADSTEVNPFTADKLCITSGERFAELETGEIFFHFAAANRGEMGKSFHNFSTANLFEKGKTFSNTISKNQYEKIF
jgi:FtsP/CotA-like multicopper oxidase with cupredoxin domain